MTGSDVDGTPPPPAALAARGGRATARHALLTTFENLSHYHREHEQHYGAAPLESAARVMRASRTLKALAEHWATAAPATAAIPLPFAGAPDLNDERAIEADGVLFLEAGGRAGELDRMVRELNTAADDAEATGTWMATAMERSWELAERLLELPELDDLLAERHRIIANDWRSASLLQLVALHLRRATMILDRADLTVAGLRADLAGARRAPALTMAAAELLDQAADLQVESATLVRQNERRWRLFHARVATLLAAAGAPSGGRPSPA